MEMKLKQIDGLWHYLRQGKWVYVQREVAEHIGQLQKENDILRMMAIDSYFTEVNQKPQTRGNY